MFSSKESRSLGDPYFDFEDSMYNTHSFSLPQKKLPVVETLNLGFSFESM